MQGLGTSRAFSPHARERYKNTFGATNQEITLGNHTFVLLDAPKLIEEDYQRYAAEVRFGEWDAQAGGSIAFLQRLGKSEFFLSLSLALGNRELTSNPLLVRVGLSTSSCFRVSAHLAVACAPDPEGRWRLWTRARAREPVSLGWGGTRLPKDARQRDVDVPDGQGQAQSDLQRGRP